jgi:hypothetical protein
MLFAITVVIVTTIVALVVSLFTIVNNVLITVDMNLRTQGSVGYIMSFITRPSQLCITAQLQCVICHSHRNFIHTAVSQILTQLFMF